MPAKAEKNESFKVGDKVTYLGHPGEITKVNKEMTGAITYNVAYNKGTGRTKATNIYNKGGEIKAVKEQLKEEMDGGRLFDYFKSKGYDITERRPDGYPPKEGVEGYHGKSR